MSSLTLLYVNPIAGDDAVGDGGERAPFKTITQALKAAQPNTVIVLIPGTYSAQTGEVFPLKLKPGVTIQGDTRNRGKDIVIQGGASYLSPTFASQNITILGVHQAGLAGVTVTNPNPRGYGLWIESASPVILENTFTGNTHDGISVVGSSAPVVRGNYFYANGANGITIYGNSRPEVRENLFIKTGFGINIAQDAAPTIIGNRIVQNQDGIVAQANAQPIIRGNLIEQNLRDGVVAIAQARPDLGSANDPGANIFSNNGRFDINSNASSQAISAFGNELASDRTSGRIDLAGSANAVSVASVPASTSVAINPATGFEQTNSEQAETIRPLEVQRSQQTKTIRPLEVRVQPFQPISTVQAIAKAPTTPALPTVKPDFPALDPLSKPTTPAQPTVSVKSVVLKPVAASASPPSAVVEVEAKVPSVTLAPTVAAVSEPLTPTANSTPTSPVMPATVVAVNSRPSVTTTQPVTTEPAAISIEVPPPEVATTQPATSPIAVTRPEAINPVVQPPQQPTASNAIAIEVPPPETAPAIATAPPKAPVTAAIAAAPPKAAAPSSMTAAAFPVPSELKPTSKKTEKPAAKIAAQPSPALRSQPISAYSFRTRGPAQPGASAASRSTPSSKSRQPTQQLTLPPIPKPGATAIAIPVPPPETARTTPPVRVAARPSRRPQLPVLPPKPVATQSTAPVVAAVVVPAASPTSIEIPVPAPETNAVIPTVPPAPTSAPAIAAIPQPSTPATSGDVLPVPGPDIPVGHGGGDLPNVLVARNPLDGANSLPFSNQSAALGSRYRVVVQVDSEDEQAEVAAIAPNAFRTLSNGRMVVQVGSFSNRDNADKMMQTLSSQGLKAAIEPLN
jgi:parallel beta-helix repeat protein